MGNAVGSAFLRVYGRNLANYGEPVTIHVTVGNGHGRCGSRLEGHRDAAELRLYGHKIERYEKKGTICSL